MTASEMALAPNLITQFLHASSFVHAALYVQNRRRCDQFCTVVIRLNARTLNASAASSGKTASTGLEGSGEECRMAEAADLFGLSV